MKLTHDAVMAIYNECRTDETEEEPINVNAIVHEFVFNKDKIEENKPKIAELLDELPIQFKTADEGGGGGWTFLNACVDKNDIHWGEHPIMEVLVALGIAAGMVEFLMPREMWKMFPGAMPYFVVKTPTKVGA